MMEIGKKNLWMVFVTAVIVGCSGGCPGVGSGTSTQALCPMNSTDPCCPGSPIVVDMLGDGIDLTSAEDGTIFMLRPWQPGLWAWTKRDSDDAFLVLDRDRSGRIDSGAEMFGDGSVQLASSDPNGFNALAYYDLPSQGGNGDHRIDSQDTVWKDLRLWQDRDHDGYSAAYELVTLDDAGVHAFSLDATKSSGVDEHGNEFRYTSTIEADAPVSTTVSDVWLTQRPLPRGDDDGDGKAGRTERDYVEWTCFAWAYAVQYNTWDPAHPENMYLKICDAPGTEGDPIATSYYQFSRLIARSYTSTDMSTAVGHAHNYVTNTMASGNPYCLADRFPVPDSYMAGPYYDDGGGPSAFFPRIKCISKMIHTGGGGGCALPDLSATSASPPVD